MRFLRSGKQAFVLLTAALTLFTPTLLVGCKSEKAKENEKIVEEGDKALKMTDQELYQKASEIQRQKGSDPSKMTPQEQGIFSAALRKGLL